MGRREWNSDEQIIFSEHLLSALLPLSSLEFLCLSTEDYGKHAQDYETVSDSTAAYACELALRLPVLEHVRFQLRLEQFDCLWQISRLSDIPGTVKVEKLTGEPAERLLKEGPFARDSGWR